LQETNVGVASWGACGSGSSSALSAIVAATATNTIANGNFGAQIWNWAQTSNSQTAFTFGETTAATGTNDLELVVKTLAGSTAIPLSVISSLTGSQAIPSLSVTPTWNTTGVVDAGIFENVTNTASGTGSLVLDLQVNGSSVLKTDQLGNVTAVGSFQTAGTTAGFVDYPQGSTSVAVRPCNASTSICEQAPTSVTSYLVNKPGVAANGIITNNVTAAVDTQGFSGDANHSAVVVIGSGTSISSTSLCSTTYCPAGTYNINAYLEITTACGTTGSYTVNLIYTDDQGTKTVPINLNGTGSVPATGVVTTTSTSNFGQETQTLHSTGAASINYSTTAVACGTAGPMVGKLFLSVVPVQ
jgi:hypothetical protein